LATAEARPDREIPTLIPPCTIHLGAKNFPIFNPGNSKFFIIKPPLSKIFYLFHIQKIQIYEGRNCKSNVKPRKKFIPRLSDTYTL
jgi:hypothetical protein